MPMPRKSPATMGGTPNSGRLVIGGGWSFSGGAAAPSDRTEAVTPRSAKWDGVMWSTLAMPQWMSKGNTAGSLATPNAARARQPAADRSVEPPPFNDWQGKNRGGREPTHQRLKV